MIWLSYWKSYCIFSNPLTLYPNCTAEKTNAYMKQVGKKDSEISLKMLS